MHKLLTFCLIFLPSLTLTAADSLRVRFGVNGHIGTALPSLLYYGTTNIPNCCPEFTHGQGSVYSIGAIAEIPLSQSFFLGMRGSFTSVIVDLTQEENTIGLINNSQGNIRFIHSFTATFPGISSAALFGWKTTSSLSLATGPGIHIITSPTFSQKESIAQGTPGTFIDGKRVRNEYSGTMNDAQSLNWEWNIIAAYDLGLDNKRSFFISPEIQYIHSLSNNVKTNDNSFWHNSSLRGGIAFKYRPHHKPEPVIIPTPPPSIPTPTPPAPIPPTASINVEIIGQDSKSTSKNINIEEFVSTEMYPLLRYIFFDEMSASIPSRYNTLPRTDVGNINERTLAQKGAMALYYNVLNIIGKRMRENPQATITLTGCLSGSKEELNMPKLAQQRVETIAQYLFEIWGISQQRVRLVQRTLPAVPANIARTEGLEENRRVEISSDYMGITDPIIITDTIIQGTSMIKYTPQIQAKEGLNNWNLVIKKDNVPLMELSEKTLPQKPVEYNIIQNNKHQLSSSGNLYAVLTVTDNKNQTIKVSADSIPYSVLSVTDKRKTRKDDNEFDRYRLLLFGYDQSSLSEEHKRILTFIQPRVHNDAKIIIRGSTDNIGDSEYNNTLSLQRAKESAKALGLQAETMGVGTSGAGYDNTLPEGRFYNRTVEIQVTNPVR